MSRLLLPYAGLVALLAAGSSVAQPRFDEIQPGLLDTKELARAKFEASQGNPRDLRQARLDVALADQGEREKQFAAGRAIIHFLLESSLHVLEARLALSGQEADRAAAAEARWRFAYTVERTEQFSYEAGRVPLEAILEPRLNRLESESRLSPLAKTIPATNGLLPLSERDQQEFATELAKERFEATQRTPEERNRARLETARSLYAGYLDQWTKGKVSGIALFDLPDRVLEAAIAVSPDAATRLAAQEQRWLHHRLTEQINELQYDAGRIGIQDLSLTRYKRLTAEIALLELRAKNPQVRPVTPPLPIQQLDLPVPDSLHQARDIARWKQQLGQTSVRELTQARLEAARIITGACAEMYIAGRAPDFLFADWLALLRDAELAVATTPAERLAALERWSALAWHMERIAKAHYDSGRIPSTEYLDARARRLDAEIRMVEARGKK